MLRLVIKINLFLIKHCFNGLIVKGEKLINFFRNLIFVLTKTKISLQC